MAAENLRGILGGHKKLVIVNEALKEGWLKDIALRGEKEKALFELLSVSLGFGEASSIAVAKARGYIFACDDRVARKEADLQHVRLTGTIGLLIKAVKKKVINSHEADVILNQMIANGFYSPVKSIKDIYKSTESILQPLTLLVFNLLLNSIFSICISVSQFNSALESCGLHFSAVKNFSSRFP